MPMTQDVSSNGAVAFGAGAFGMQPLPPPSAVGSSPSGSSGSAGPADSGGFSPTVAGWLTAAAILVAIRVVHERYGARLE